MAMRAGPAVVLGAVQRLGLQGPRRNLKGIGEIIGGRADTLVADLAGPVPAIAVNPRRRHAHAVHQRHGDVVAAGIAGERREIYLGKGMDVGVHTQPIRRSQRGAVLQSQYFRFRDRAQAAKNQAGLASLAP